jgi:hypothetical protein
MIVARLGHGGGRAVGIENAMGAILVRSPQQLPHVQPEMIEA